MKPLLIGLGVAVGVWLIVTSALAIFGRRSAARELASFLPNLVFLFKGLLRDPRVPKRSKFWVLFAVAWIASPIDLIPEFIPVAGPLDDAIVAALVLRHLIRTSGPEVVREHWRGDPAVLDRLLGVGRI